MPTSTNTIWIDSTFDEHDVDNVVVKVECEMMRPEGIGNFSIPSNILFRARDNTFIDIQEKYTTATGVLDSYYDVSIGFLSVSNDSSYLIDNEVNSYFSYLSSSGVSDVGNKYFNNNLPLSSYKHIKSDIINGNRYYKDSNTTIEYISNSGIHLLYDLNNDYLNFTGSINASGIPIPLYDLSADLMFTYTVCNDELSNSIVNSDVDIFFAGWVDYTFVCGLCSSDETVAYPLDICVTTNNGINKFLSSDIYSVIDNRGIVGVDVYSSETDALIIDNHIDVLYGVVSPINVPIIVGNAIESHIKAEVALYSIRISDISLKPNEFIIGNNSIKFSITDDVYGVSIDDCTLYIDDVEFGIEYDVIDNGAVFSFDFNPDNFFNKESTLSFRIHAENNIGMMLDKTVYLTFGYVVEYKNSLDNRFIDGYGFSNKIAVRVDITDSSICNNKTTLGWEFESRPISNSSMSASINGRLYDADFSGLRAEIYPVSTAYFYNKDFDVVIKAKDLAGNVMDNLYINFRIEEKP